MQEDIKTFVGQLIEHAGFDLTMAVEHVGDQPEDIRVVFSGEDRGLLLSRGAKLLDAIEYVTNRAFGKQMSHDARIVFDSGNYRARREQELRMMAEAAAERVRRFRSAFTFEPMTPHERRIIHVTLNEDRSVRTESVGDGAERKVRIIPT